MAATTSEPEPGHAIGRAWLAATAALLLVACQAGQGCASQPTHADQGGRAPQSRSTMPRFAIWSPGVISSHDSGLLDIFAVSTRGKKRVLHTTRFFQGGAEMRRLVAEEPVSWDVEVPEGAALFGVTGVVSGMPQQFWVGWVLNARLHMQALKQEAPVNTDLVAQEAPIFPAIMDADGRAALYSWRAADSGASLWRRVFSGDIHKPGTVTSAAVTDVPGKAAVSVAAAIPAETKQHALVGWLEDTTEGSRMGLAIVRPDGVRIFRSDPIPKTTALVRQRLGIWATSFDRVELAAILRTHEGSGGYDLARFAIAPSSDKGTVTLLPHNLAAGAIQSAAIDYYKDDSEPNLYQSFVTTDGLLLTAYAAGQPPMRKRRATSVDDPLPVITTASAAFYGVRSDEDVVTFEPL